MSSRKINYIFPDLRTVPYLSWDKQKKRKQCWPDCTWPFFYYHGHSFITMAILLLKGEETANDDVHQM